MNEYEYIVDAFTQDGNNTDLDVTHLTVGCISSTNNKFNLDSEGNLTVKSITYENSSNIDFNAIYPIGSIYLSVTAANPNTLFGGTWEQIKDKFLLSCGDIYQNGVIGGESTHQLTVDEMPSHTHIISASGGHEHSANYLEVRSKISNQASNNVARPNTSSYDSTGIVTTSNGTHTHTPSLTGGSTAHNNMPPYLTVYMWKRTA